MQTSSIYDKCDVKSHWKQYWHHKLFFIVTFLTGGEPGIKMISFEYFAPCPSLPSPNYIWGVCKKKDLWNVSNFEILCLLSGDREGQNNANMVII